MNRAVEKYQRTLLAGEHSAPVSEPSECGERRGQLSVPVSGPQPLVGGAAAGPWPLPRRRVLRPVVSSRD
jgi:hypothetical protein